MKATYNSFLACLWAVIIVLSVVAYLLCSQYYYVKKEVEELTEVKESYYQQIEMLKKSLGAVMQLESSEDEDVEKKKNKRI